MITYSKFLICFTFFAIVTIITTRSNPELREAVIIPSHLLYAIWNFVDYMAGYAQQDAHEFLIAFLNSLDHQLNIPNDTENLFKEVSFQNLDHFTCVS